MKYLCDGKGKVGYRSFKDAGCKQEDVREAEEQGTQHVRKADMAEAAEGPAPVTTEEGRGEDKATALKKNALLVQPMRDD